MNESTQLSFIADTSLLSEFLTHIGLILLGMIEPFESSVRELAIHGATSALLRIVILAFLRLIKVSIRRSSVVEWLVLVDAKIPIVVLGLVGARCCLVPVHVEKDRVDVPQVNLEPLLEGFMLEFNFELIKVEDHCCQIRQIKMGGLLAD
jgi:hypothetical protein